MELFKMKALNFEYNGVCRLLFIFLFFWQFFNTKDLYTGKTENTQ